MSEKISIIKVLMGIMMMIVGTISLFFIFNQQYGFVAYGLVAMLNSIIAILFSCLLIIIGFVVLSNGLGYY